MTENKDSLPISPEWRPETVTVQAGRPARTPGAPMNPPITLSTTYVHTSDIGYGRDGNSGWIALETALGKLEGGIAVTFASGLAAATAIADLVPTGGTVVLPNAAYYGVKNVFQRMEAHGRLKVRIVDADKSENVIAALDGANMVWMESVANPSMVVTDIPAIEMLEEGWDIIFYNRLSPLDQDWEEVRKQMNVKIVMDMDDDWILPPNHLNYYDYLERKPIIENNFRYADLVTCTNQNIADRIYPFNKNIQIIPNALPYGHHQFTTHKRYDERVRIFWAGGVTHQHDLEILKYPLQRLKPLSTEKKGIWPAIQELLDEGDWEIEERFKNNNGLTILKRKNDN